MRHEGIRTIISSQSPKMIPLEILELSSVTFLHSFESAEWFRYLQNINGINEEDLDAIKSLKCGEALVNSRGWKG